MYCVCPPELMLIMFIAQIMLRTSFIKLPPQKLGVGYLSRSLRRCWRQEQVKMYRDACTLLTHSMHLLSTLWNFILWLSFPHYLYLRPPAPSGASILFG